MEGEEKQSENKPFEVGMSFTGGAACPAVVCPAGARNSSPVQDGALGELGRLLLAQGLGKRVATSLFRTQKRGGKGLRAIKLNPGDTLAAVDTVRLQYHPFISCPLLV
jgi:hypothetical protein